MRYSRINMSRAELLTELTGILAESADPRSRNDRHLGEVIWQLVDRLRFCGAGVYEPRGLSDTRLSDEDMHQISLYNLPPHPPCLRLHAGCQQGHGTTAIVRDRPHQTR